MTPPRASTTPARNSHSASVFLMIGVVALYFGALFPSPEFCAFNKNDGALFLTLGINLAEHGRYTTDVTPGEVYGRNATWPFVFPVALAGVIRVFGVSWFALKSLLALCGILNLFLLLQLWKHETWGQVAVLATALNAVYFLFSHHTMTEVPFMLACTGTLVLLERSRSTSGALIAGCCAAVAFLTRGYAVAFLPAGMIYLLVAESDNRKLGRRALMSICFAVPLIGAVGAWWAWTNVVISSGQVDGLTQTYGNIGVLKDRISQPLGFFAREIYWYHLRTPLYLLAPVVPLQEVLQVDGVAIPTAFLLLLVAGGWAHSIARRLRAFDAWVPFGIALMVFAHPAPRYWLTYFPFVVYYLLYGVWVLSSRLRSPEVARVFTSSVLLIAAALGLGRHLIWPDELRFLNSYWRDYAKMAVWCRANLPADALVITHQTTNFSVASRHRTYQLTDTNNWEWPRDELRTLDNIYLVAPSDSAPDAAARKASAIAAELLSRGGFRKVCNIGDVSLHHLTPSGEELD